MSMRSWRDRAFRVTVGCVIILGMRAPVMGQEVQSGKIEPTITVVGTGKVSVAPDVARIQVGVVTQEPTAREALNGNNAAMAALMDVLKTNGVAAKDVQTSQISVHPVYSQPRPPRPGEVQQEFVPRIVAYQVTNMVVIKARDLAKLGPILDAVVSAGANQIQGISFEVDEPNKLLEVARKEAVDDAFRKATALAGQAGVVVGPPLTIREEEAGAPPRPMMMARMMADAAAAPAMSVSPGEQELAIRVYIVYRLQLPEGAK